MGRGSNGIMEFWCDGVMFKDNISNSIYSYIPIVRHTGTPILLF